MRRTAAAALAGLLITGACGGGGDRDEAAPATTTSSTPAAKTTTTAAPAATPTTTTPASSRTTVAAGSGSAGSTPPPAAASSSASTTDLGFTAPGTYRYATTGRFSSTLGTPQARDGETVLTVDPPGGSDQRSLRQGVGRTTEQVLRLDAGGAYVVSLRQSEQGITKEVRPSPPALALPADAGPGRTWSWRAMSTDGRTTVDSSFRAVRLEDVPVGSETVNALVVEVVLSLAGDVVSTSRQTLWVSPRHRMVVRQDEATDGRLGAITFSSSSSSRLLSLTPA